MWEVKEIFFTSLILPSFSHFNSFHPLSFPPLSLSPSLTPSISSRVKPSPPFFTSSAPRVLPEEQTALTCICLLWKSPRFGLNAPIIPLNYDVLFGGCVSPSLWLSSESWLWTTDPFTGARFRALLPSMLCECTWLNTDIFCGTFWDPSLCLSKPKIM